MSANLLLRPYKVKRKIMLDEKNPLNPEFGRRLKEAMERKFGTKQGNQRKFAKVLGATDTEVSLYLRGRVPMAPRLVQMRKILGVSIDWLLTGPNVEDQQVRNLSPAVQAMIPMLAALTPELLDALAQYVELLSSRELDIIALVSEDVNKGLTILAQRRTIQVQQNEIQMLRDRLQDD